MWTFATKKRLTVLLDSAELPAAISLMVIWSIMFYCGLIAAALTIGAELYI
jgi:hypothetical protein